MAGAQPDPAELQALQDAIYRDKILRARAMSMEERFREGLELSNGVLRRMLDGAMWQLDTTDEELGWNEVRRRLRRLDDMEAQGRAKPISVP